MGSCLNKRQIGEPASHVEKKLSAEAQIEWEGFHTLQVAHPLTGCHWWVQSVEILQSGHNLTPNKNILFTSKVPKTINMKNNKKRVSSEMQRRAVLLSNANMLWCFLQAA